MKTETQIAEENIKEIKERRIDSPHKTWEYGTNPELYRYEGQTEEHKSSCQRFLEFLEDYPVDSVIEKKIQDLKQAIKLYDDAGI